MNYRTAQPDPQDTTPDRQMHISIEYFTDVFTPDECNQIINTTLNDWDQRESMIQRDKDNKIEQNFEEDLDYRNTTLFIPNRPDEWLFDKIIEP